MHLILYKHIYKQTIALQDRKTQVDVVIGEIVELYL